MKTSRYFLLALVLFGCSEGFAQSDSSKHTMHSGSVRILTIEPSIGIHTNFGTDLLISTLVQWNPHRHLGLASHSSFNINNITQRSFNNIETNYNYSLNQKFGIGASMYTKRSSHTFLLMAGAKYTSYQETLVNPSFSNATASIDSWNPDYGLMYSLKRGWKKYFFTCRVYLPLYPWPTKGSNILYTDSNMQNVALEFGAGITIKRD